MMISIYSCFPMGPTRGLQPASHLGVTVAAASATGEDLGGKWVKVSGKQRWADPSGHLLGAKRRSEGGGQAGERGYDLPSQGPQG